MNFIILLYEIAITFQPSFCQLTISSIVRLFSLLPAAAAGFPFFF
jgi:hypothetical protein